MPVASQQAPMRMISLHDRSTIAQFLQQAPLLHLYALGDLDAAFWPSTLWYGLQRGETLRALVLGYLAGSELILQALSHTPDSELATLLRGILALLPRRFYAHLSPGLETILAEHYQLVDHGRHLKLALSDPAPLYTIDTGAVSQLGPHDAAELQAFYDSSHPGHWFDPRTLASGQYFGLREQGQLLSVAGVHVFSETYRVAALGNIVTHPAARGRGLATRVTAQLCRALLPRVDHIGLNVHASNQAALAVYARLGFSEVAQYGEFSCQS